jgi:hypothetical protein
MLTSIIILIHRWHYDDDYRSYHMSSKWEQFTELSSGLPDFTEEQFPKRKHFENATATPPARTIAQQHTELL